MVDNSEQPAVVRPNKPVLWLAAVAGCTLGLLPYALFIQRREYLVVYAAVAALIAAVRVTKFKTLSHEAPSVFEFVLGGIGSGALSTVAGLFGLAVYALLLWGIRLIDVVTAWFGSTFVRDGSDIALYGSLAWAALLGLVYVWPATDGMARKLYPDAAGALSPYAILIGERRRLLVYVAVGVVTLAGLLLVLDRSTATFHLLLQLHFMMVSTPLWTIGDERPHSRSKAATLQALKELLEAAGFEVVPAPRTGDPDIDPLMRNIDLLASDEQRTLAIDVKTALGGPALVDWVAASELQTVAWALRERYSLLGDAPVSVEPMLLLVGRAADDSLVAFAQDERFRIVAFDDNEAIAAALAGESPQDRAHRARARLGLEGAGAGVVVEVPRYPDASLGAER